jgi:hypothetical protein
MPTDKQLRGFARSAQEYALGRQRDGVEVDAKDVYDRLVQGETEIEAEQAKGRR